MCGSQFAWLAALWQHAFGGTRNSYVYVSEITCLVFLQVLNANEPQQFVLSRLTCLLVVDIILWLTYPYGKGALALLVREFPGVAVREPLALGPVFWVIPYMASLATRFNGGPSASPLGLPYETTSSRVLSSGKRCRAHLQSLGFLLACTTPSKKRLRKDLC